MKKIEVWKAQINSSRYKNDYEFVYVMASKPATASERALRVAKKINTFEYLPRELKTLYVSAETA